MHGRKRDSTSTIKTRNDNGAENTSYNLFLRYKSNLNKMKTLPGSQMHIKSISAQSNSKNMGDVSEVSSSVDYNQSPNQVESNEIGLLSSHDNMLPSMHSGDKKRQRIPKMNTMSIPDFLKL